MSNNYYTWQKGSNKRLTSYFNEAEFTCPCNFEPCKEQRISIDLINRLQTLRKQFKNPVKITSGFRCFFYQAALASRGYETAKGISQHELGNAADVAPVLGVIRPGETNPLTLPELMVKLKDLVEANFKASGQGKTFFHVDTRADKERRWSYVSR